MPEIVPIYQEYYVKGNIAHFIKKLWILNNPENCPALFNKGVPPNGCFTIAVIEGNGLSVRHQNQVKHLPEGVYFCGQITEPIYLDISSGTKAVMIQLFPWTLVHFGISNAQDFTDTICPIHETGIATPLDLIKMIGLSNEKICNYMTNAFRPLFRSNINTNLILESTQMIMASKGNIKVSSIASSLHCSVRHLQKIFKNHIGISPKVFIRIIKLREAIDDIVYPNTNAITMTELAISNDYYDQPHFNNTFSSVLKTTPRNFRKEDYLLTLKK